MPSRKSSSCGWPENPESLSTSVTSMLRRTRTGLQKHKIGLATLSPPHSEKSVLQATCSLRRVSDTSVRPTTLGKAHRCVEGREGSHNRHSERGQFLRRRLPYRAVAPPVLRNRNDR